MTRCLSSSDFLYMYLFFLIQKGPSTLAELQNLIKRDPQAYQEEFEQQYLHYKLVTCSACPFDFPSTQISQLSKYRSIFEIFKLRPSEPSKKLGRVVTFLSAVAHCYPDVLEVSPFI